MPGDKGRREILRFHIFHGLQPFIFVTNTSAIMIIINKRLRRLFEVTIWMIPTPSVSVSERLSARPRHTDYRLAA